MINVVKLISLLWLLFMACNSPRQQIIVTATAFEPAIAPPAVEDFITPSTTTTTSPTSNLPSGVAYDNGTTTTTFNEDNLSEPEDSALPSEIQKAVCTVTAGEVKASAEAVTTKKLKGVCGSAEMNLAFHNLETKLYKELQEIKLLLQQLSYTQNGNNLFRNTFGNENSQQSVPLTTTNTAMPTFKFEPILKENSISITDNKQAIEKLAVMKPNAPNTFGHDSKKVQSTKLKSLPSSNDKHSSRTPLREHEVSTFNNTMLTDRDFKVFTYYWRLENFTERVEAGESATVESPIFSIKGKPLHIKAFFQHLYRDFLYLQLEYATLKSNDRQNIILDMGGLFKEIVNDKVLFKHKITILDQNSQRSAKDLVSQEFNNFESGFLIPNSALLASPYIKNSSLLIQIFLFL